MHGPQCPREILGMWKALVECLQEHTHTLKAILRFGTKGNFSPGEELKYHWIWVFGFLLPLLLSSTTQHPSPGGSFPTPFQGIRSSLALQQCALFFFITDIGRKYPVVVFCAAWERNSIKVPLWFPQWKGGHMFQMFLALWKSSHECLWVK